MKPCTHLWLSLSFAVTLLVGAAGAVSAALLLAQPGLADFRKARQQLEEEQERSVWLDQQKAMVWKRTAARNEIVRALAEKRMTLAEAAELFRRLYEEAGGGVADHPDCKPGAALGEYLRRHVISWARSELHRYPASQARVTLHRLHRELCTYLGHDEPEDLSQLPGT